MRILLCLFVGMMLVSCGAETVDRRSFAIPQSLENYGGEDSIKNPESNQEKQDPITEEAPSIPVSNVEWNGKDLVGTDKLGVMALTRGAN